MNITINTDILAAVSLFRTIDDIRYYLNGLLLETGVHGARLVGCDGHQLAVARIVGEYPESSIILPGSLVARVKSKPKRSKSIELEFKEGHKTYKIKDNAEGVFVPRDIMLILDETTTSTKELDGKFPDYRRVVPGEVDGTTAQFEPSLINRIDKACSLLGYKFFSGIAHNGKNSALSVINEDFVVVTMPFDSDPPRISPAWVQELLFELETVRFAA